MVNAGSAMFHPRNFDPACPARVVSICDLSTAGMNAALRATMLAEQLDVPVRLLYPEEDGARDGHYPRAISKMIASARPNLPISACSVQADSAAEALAGARDALVVIPCLGGNPVRERVIGAPAERLIRLSRAPVLVVKRPARAAYQRVLVAVDLREHCEQLLSVAVSFGTGSCTAVFHSVAPSSSSLAPDFALERPRRRAEVDRACAAMQELLATVGNHPTSPQRQDGSVFSVFSVGPAAETILAGETAHRADLVVIGKCRRGMWGDFLLGGVTQRVLARCEADVLIVPMPPETQAHPNLSRRDVEANHSHVALGGIGTQSRGAG